MRRGGWMAVAVLLLTGILGGCARERPTVYLTSGYALSGTSYGRLLERYSRSAELYDGVDTVAKGHATWRSPELRDAAVEVGIERYHLSGERAERFREEQRKEHQGVRPFHLALYTPKEGWNDLETQQTLWRVFLELPDGEKVDAVRIRYLPKTDKSAVMYPYITPWTREYSLEFPVWTEGSPPEHLDLVLAGPLGTLRFPF